MEGSLLGMVGERIHTRPLSIAIYDTDFGGVSLRHAVTLNERHFPLIASAFER